MIAVYKLRPFPKLTRATLIAGLPGIGSVGKLAVDFVASELKAKKLCELQSWSFPHSIFINEAGLAELPTVTLSYTTKPRVLLFLTGDIQPVEKEPSYEFATKVLELGAELGLAEIITLGGIGLPSPPEQPGVFCTANNAKTLAHWKSESVSTKLHGIVGPIVGAAGLLVGLAARRRIPAACLLVETGGHPLYVGVPGAKALLGVLNSQLRLGLDLAKFEASMAKLEAEMVRKAEELSKVMTKKAKPGKGPTYIG